MLPGVISEWCLNLEHHLCSSITLIESLIMVLALSLMPLEIILVLASLMMIVICQA